MAVNFSPFGPVPQFEKADGLPAIGYQVFWYVGGSVGTKKNTYTDLTGLVASTNPVIMNSLGNPTGTQMCLTVGETYKAVYAPVGDSDPPTSPIWTVDNIVVAGAGATAFDQWVPYGAAPTFVNATSFTVPGDATSIFQVNRRVKTINSGGTIYSTITASVFGALTTVTVVNDSGVLDSGLSAVSYGLLTPQNPSVPATYALSTGIQSQLYTGFTTGGGTTAFTLTPSPAITANATRQRFNITLNAAPTGSPTLAVSGQAALSLKYYDANGTKQFINSTVAPSGWTSDVINDGTDWVMQSILVSSLTHSSPVRQTVLSGPVDTSGLPSFGGATGTTVVTATGSLIATAANGAQFYGVLDHVASITNPSWTGLSSNGTMYLYLDITTDGIATTGSSTLPPTYRWGGADVVTNGQHTFNIQEMQMKVGNGATAAQTYRTFVGEVTIAGNVVTAIVWYALMGRYMGQWTATLPGTTTTTSANHNLGIANITGSQQVKPVAHFEIECTTIDAGAAVGDLVTDPMSNITGSFTYKTTPVMNGNACYIKTGGVAAFGIVNGAGATALTAASWKYRFRVDRGW